VVESPETFAAITAQDPELLPRNIRCVTSNTEIKLSKRNHPEFASTCRSIAIRALLLRCANAGRVSVQDRLGDTGPICVPSLPGTRHIARATAAGPCASVLKT